MSSSTSRLRRLLADLLTASRLQSTAVELERTAVPVHGFVADAVSHARGTTQDVDIRLDCPEDLAVMGDRDRLAQMMDNLIGNAMRHGTPPVHVTVTAGDEQVTIRVRDEGAGVSDEMAPRLFDRFATGMEGRHRARSVHRAGAGPRPWWGRVVRAGLPGGIVRKLRAHAPESGLVAAVARSGRVRIRLLR